MLDSDLNVAQRLSGDVRVSNNVALFLSKKVTEVQREIAHQLRAEVADHTRSETAKKEPDKGRMEEKDDDKEELGVLPDGDTNESASQKIRQLNITV